MALTPGTKLGPYQIQSPLGAGGMGEVYRATDTKLGRDVALKVLPAEMAADAERLGRFRREAKTLAQLDHPNIVTIYSVEECDGVHFLTMQLVEGLPLDRLIPQGGLVFEQIVEIAGALGDALAAAHEKGIVHRDLKPANVMVSNDGRVKVLDFGLAKDVRGSNLGDATMTSASQTQLGIVMGTPAYMSPEQTSGRPLDHRTDIFSMGVLLYEMATGRRPFDGSSSAELVSSILRDSPPSVSDSRPDLPSDLARVVRRCLEKDPRHRVQTARDVSNEFRDLARHTSQKVAPASNSRAVSAADSGGTRTDEGFWVAVLPFKYAGGNADLKALADGLSEDIVTGLSRFSYLRVIARSSTLRYANEVADVRSAGKQLGARYVMEGSLRQAGSRLRLAVQLVDSTSGAHLWAETYDRPFQSEQLFELQDELVPRIVSTVGETHGVLPYSMSETLRNRDPNRLTPYEAVLRAFAYFKHVNAEEHIGARAALERAVEQAPGNADCWAMLAMLYREENNHGFNVRPDPVGRALTAARRAVDTAPSNHLAHHALASVLFFRREKQAFLSAAQRAIDINPMDGFTLAYMGFLISYSGDWDRGCALMEKARSLNPNHPGWYWFPPFFNAYIRGDYQGALNLALKVNMPGFWRNELALAVTYGQLGELELAHNAARELLAIRPNFPAVAREELEKWWQPELVEKLLEGLGKAGIEVERAAPVPQLTRTSGSGSARAASQEEGFWVAVLPFQYGGGSAELKALGDGLTDDIITGLSKFSYLRVISRSSSSRYLGQSVDVRTAGKELNARYVMEGTLRQAGNRLRLAVQLVDTVSGAHLWAENYERSFSPEAIFELQDDLVPRIVSTVADMNGVLPRSMSEAVRGKTPEQLTPYEAVLRSFAYPQLGTPEELTVGRAGLEAALRKAPAYADAWAMLSFLCGQDFVHGYELQANALETAASAARRAVELGPSNHIAHFSQAATLWYQKDYDSFRDAAERAVALNPMDGNLVAFMGELLTYTGDVERGMELAERAKKLNPNHPGWYWASDFYQAFSAGDYRKALSFGQKAKLQGFPLASMFIATACGHLGDVEGGAKAVSDLVKFRPELPAIMPKQVAKVWNAEYGARFLEGLRKAGMEIPVAGQNSSTQTSSMLRSGAVQDSGAARAEEGFWVAVLPFKYSGNNAALVELVDGLTEDITTGLSRFSYLKVIARSSTERYATADVRSAGKELGARFVIEGSLRHAGTKLRLAVQLVDASLGTHIWAENFERAFDPETVFALQDELVPRIVSTVADAHGILPHTMSEGIRSKMPEQLTPYEAVWRSFGYAERLSPAEHVIAREALEHAVRVAPNYAYAWAMLSFLCGDEYSFGFNPKPGSLERALHAAQRAVELDSSGHRGYQALASVHFHRKEFQAFRTAAEKAIALNPMDGCNIAQLGALICYAGEWERGCALVEKALGLNPNHPGWYWFPLCFNAYRKRDYSGALNFALKINMPGLHSTHMVLAAVYGQLGQREEAGRALQELLKLRPDIPAIVRPALWVRFDAEFSEHLIDGLRKAGLEIAEAPGEPTAIAIKSGSGSTRADQGFWVAVLPFKAASGDAELEALADCLSEDVTTGLSRFPYLQVIAHNSALAYKGRATDIRTVGRELGARYVLEGSIRRRGRAIRVSAQLMDAVSGTQLWAEAYDRELGGGGNGAADAFQIQDDLTDHIVTSIADGHGVLVRSMAAPTRDRKVEDLSLSELVLRYYAFMQQVNIEEHAALRTGFELALERESNYALGWACLSNLYVLEYGDGFNPLEKPMERAREAAWRAVKIDPACQMGWKMLSVVYFFNRDFAAFREAAERAIALNPRDGTTLAYVGIMMAYSGDWERGVAMVQRAIDLNRHHPGWYYNASFAHHYRKGEYEEALLAAKKINMPEYHWTHIAIAACCGMLGRPEEALAAIESLRKHNPTFLDLENIREEIARWDPDQDEVERLMQGLLKAGLKYGSGDVMPVAEIAVPSPGSSVPTASHAVAKADSGAVRANEGFWVAVLPFKYAGTSAELRALAGGLSEEIVTGLSRFSYLHVIARGSTAKYSSESGDVRSIGKELGARFVMEGSLRQAGAKLRLAVQLVDATTGAHLWAETYERVFSAETVFDLQDDLVPRIVSTVADQYGILPRSMSEVLRSKKDEDLTPHEAVLRAFSYFTRITAEEHAIVRRILEHSVRQAPDHADSWAMLSMIYRGEFAQGYNPGLNPLDRALAAAQRAVDLSATHALGHYALATVYFFRKEMVQFRVEAERALALNPLDASVRAYLGLLTATTGEWDRGCEMVESAMQLNANCPGYFYFARCCNGYRQGKYAEVLEAAARVNMPNYFHTHAMCAAALGQLGRHEEARKAVKELLALRPDFATTARQEYAKWYDPELIEHLIEGLRKAGLEIPKAPKT